MLNFEEKRYLPFSGRRFIISQYGEIFDCVGNRVQSLDDGENIKVSIEWIFGKKEYNVAMLVYFSFRTISLHVDLWDNLVPVFKDGNYKNLNLVNIFYRFKKYKLEVENVKGFYYIPLYTRYAINENGDIINVETNNLKSWHITKPVEKRNSTGGYYQTRVVNDFGNSTNLLRHRAMGLVFLKYPPDFENYVINHKNGIPGSDNFENLEWVTLAENNRHAIKYGLIQGKNKPILMWDLRKDVIKKFDSIKQCGEYLGYTERISFISSRLKYSPGKVFPDMLLFKYDDGSEWPKIDKEQISFCRLGKAQTIVARNVFTGDKIVFDGFARGESLLGINQNTIRKHAGENMDIPYMGYNFRYKDLAKEWPNHTERHLEIYRKFPINPSNGVIVKNIDTNDEYFFTSANEVCEKFSIRKGTLSFLMSNKKVFRKKYIFSWFNLRERLGPPIK